MVWMLCIVTSEFRNSTVPPCSTPTTCGTYWQPFWSITTGFGSGSPALIAPAGPLFTYTNTFASLPPSATTCSVYTFSPFNEQAGSIEVSISTFAGTFPENVTVPITDPVGPLTATRDGADDPFAPDNPATAPLPAVPPSAAPGPAPFPGFPLHPPSPAATAPTTTHPIAALIITPLTPS